MASLMRSIIDNVKRPKRFAYNQEVQRFVCLHTTYTNMWTGTKIKGCNLKVYEVLHSTRTINSLKVS